MHYKTRSKEIISLLSEMTLRSHTHGYGIKMLSFCKKTYKFRFCSCLLIISVRICFVQFDLPFELPDLPSEINAKL